MPHGNLNKNPFCHTTVNKRRNNEDQQSTFLLPYAEDALPIRVVIVADGMGGHEHGEDVSQQAVLKVKEFLNESIEQVYEGVRLTPEDLKNLLRRAIESTNQLVLRMVEINDWKRAGSTIVIAAILGDQLIAANLGDSPLFHYQTRQRKVVRVTQDHSVPGILAQAKLISEEMVRYHERRGQLEFFLGAEALPPLDFVYERTLEPDDLVLLCSDGVSGLMKLEQIEEVLGDSSSSLEEKANQLIQTARTLGETDNQTLILWQYSAMSAQNDRTSRSKLSSREALPAPDLEINLARSDISQSTSQSSYYSRSTSPPRSSIETSLVRSPRSRRRNRIARWKLGIVLILLPCFFLGRQSLLEK